MRRLPVLAFTVLASLPAFAEGYSFHLRITDGRTALLANPHGAPPAEQLEGAAKTRVLLFERVQGAKFVWLMVGCPEGKVSEYSINERGVSNDDGDVALAPKESGMVATRCLRAQCRIDVTDGGERRVNVTLNKGQSADLPLGADFAFDFDR